MFEQKWPQVAALNAIGLCWIRDPDEQAEARAYLAKAAGRNYDDPGLYMKWWRNTFFEVTY